MAITKQFFDLSYGVSVNDLQVISANGSGNFASIISNSFTYANGASIISRDAEFLDVKANTIYIQGVDASQNTNITAAFSKANSATLLAQDAFNYANTIAGGGTSIDQFIRTTANSASSNTIYTQGVDATQNTNISTAQSLAQSSYNQANSALTIAWAAYNQANTGGGGASADTYARDTANSASSNTIVIQGVDATQNTNITAADTKAQASFNVANSASHSTSATTKPSNPVVGDFWYNQTNDVAYRYTFNGSTYFWLDVSSGAYRSYDTSRANTKPAQIVVQYLVVAGGGGGSGGLAGNWEGSGGGAGGLLTNILTANTDSTLTVVVGAGGPAGGGGGVYNPSGTGQNSTLSGSGFSTITAYGGGYGAGQYTSGGSGGSGGGGWQGGAGGGVAGQGYAGNGGVYNQGGGGAGGPPNGNYGGPGANSSITGSVVTYAVGGSGSTVGATSGGTGNGGAPAGDGLINTGGGGGGGAAGGNYPGGAGGSGVVILSLPTQYYSANVTGTYTATEVGSNTVIRFTGSGTYTI